MSTLPFLLSVADELDNINSQSYMDDFGLGFHPHRQFYRTPTIQLSLPSSTDWMQERQQRCRHRFVDDPDNNVHSTLTDAHEMGATAAPRHRHYRVDVDADANGDADADGDADGNGGGGDADADAVAADAHDRGDGDAGRGKSAANRRLSRDRYQCGRGVASGSQPRHAKSAHHNDCDANIDIGGHNDIELDGSASSSLQLSNLNKKCCKNYYRHGGSRSTNCEGKAGGSDALRPSKSTGLHSRCLEGNNSSSEESLQKVTSSIEFLTCFLLKKSRASKNQSSTSTSTSTSGRKKS